MLCQEVFKYLAGLFVTPGAGFSKKTGDFGPILALLKKHLIGFSTGRQILDQQNSATDSPDSPLHFLEISQDLV